MVQKNKLQPLNPLADLLVRCYRSAGNDGDGKAGTWDPSPGAPTRAEMVDGDTAGLRPSCYSSPAWSGAKYSPGVRASGEDGWGCSQP